jgi:CIC family chloride channel protein
VQIGSALGSTVGQAFRLSDERVTNLVACGAAGGIAATFNAPIAGAIFAMEVILGRLHTLYFGAVVVSAVVADVIAQSIEGDHTAFIVPSYSLASPVELLLYTLLGVVAAVLSVAFSRGLYAMEDIWDALPMPEYVKPAIGGLLLGVLGLLTFQDRGFPRIFGVGYETITSAAVGDLALYTVAGLFLLKMLATSLTLGSGGSGGVFAPSLFMGAMLGSTFGQVAARLFPAITGPSGGYALVGMSAFFAGAAHAPVTAILILFEMTRSYSIILPLMLATVVSTLVARLISGESIYSLKLTRRGVRLAQGLDSSILDGVRIAEVVNRDGRAASVNLPLSDLNREFTRSRGTTIPVIDAAGMLAGVVSTQDLDRALARGSVEKQTVADIATLGDLLTIQPFESIGEGLRRLEVRGLTMLPVVDPENPRRLLGSVTREELLQAYSRGLSRRARQVQLAAEASIEDGTDMNLIYVTVPAGAVVHDTSVSDLRLPRDCLIVSIERDGQRSVVRGDTQLVAGDRVAIVATQETAAAVRELLTQTPSATA